MSAVKDKRVTLDIDEGISEGGIHNDLKSRIAYFTQAKGSESLSSWARSTSEESGYAGFAPSKPSSVRKTTYMMRKARPHTANTAGDSGLTRTQSTHSLPPQYWPKAPASTICSTVPSSGNRPLSGSHKFAHRPPSSLSSLKYASSVASNRSSKQRPESATQCQGPLAQTREPSLDLAYLKRIIYQEKVTRAYFTSKEVAAERKIQICKVYRRLYHKVILVLRTLRAMQEHCCEKEPRTPVETQYYALHRCVDSKKLAFNPDDYSSSKVREKMPQWARVILLKEPEGRSEAECRRLHVLLRGMPGLDRFTEQIQTALCRAVSYMHVEAPRIILRKGHVGLNFYLIFSGSVFVNTEEEENTLLTQPRMKTRAVLARGEAFGELALLRDVKRAATVSCRQDCELLVVDRDVFARACPSLFQDELEQKVCFLSELPLFRSKFWPLEKLRALCSEAHMQEYKTNKVVVRDNKESSWMYICVKGQCSIIKCVSVDQTRTDVNTPDKHDYMLTAEFLHNNRRRTSKINDDPSKVKSELLKTRRQSIQKTEMLSSMGLDYVKKDKGTTGNQTAHQQLVERHCSVNADSVITFDSLLKLRQQMFPDKTFLYLNVGVLKEGEVFHLEEILDFKDSSKHEEGSCLILVSAGSQMLRFKKSTWWQMSNEKAVEHAKYLAIKNRYPSDENLLQSFRKEHKWTAYKHLLTRQVSAKSQNRWRPLAKYEEKFMYHQNLQNYCLTKALRKPVPEKYQKHLPAGLEK